MPIENNLWRIFRQLVEQTELPKELTNISEWILLNEEERQGNEDLQ